MRAWGRTVVLCLGLALGGPRLARADEASSAAAKFEEGQRAFAKNDFRHAGEAFEEAYRLKKHHSPLWNAARSWEAAGEVVRAANLYARFLQDAPADTRDRDQATKSVADLSKKAGRIEVHRVNVMRVRVDSEPLDLDVVFVAPGDHVLEASSAKGEVRKMVHIKAGEITSVTLAPPEPKTEPPPPDRGMRVLHPAVPLTVGGFALAGTALTIVSGLDSVSKRDAFVGNPAGQTDEQLEAGKATQTRTNIALGVTIGIGVAAIVIAALFTDWGGAKRTASAR